ncbi:transporter substrate-binding domain-containing protein [Streptococcus hillyeri]|uniref:Amino acid ABC transporter substrate-binding protein n=1 Tax=Streptococcus hillyeri TaxID=2282420 RepID=A0A3L9DT08_9STRE|nr:amino acid ABC transporter substrate-binding protein [Streptococcus hillyeri]RLY03574.1 amino acid ABC transporter substrate-binding protein [Streptococcus hillyeri]
MKKLTFGIVALASTVLLAACGSSEKTEKAADSAKSEKEKVVLATVGTTKPFSFEKDGNLTGYDVEVAKAVFKGSDKYEVEYKKTAWSSIFTGLDAGKFQMAGNNFSYSEERAAKYLYSAPTATNPLVLAVNKDSGIKSIKDIAGKKTQVVAGTSTASMLDKYNQANADKATEINYTNEDITQMLTSVDGGKFDYKIFETQSVKTIIEDQGLNNVELIEFDAADLGADTNPYVYFIFADGQDDLQKFVNTRIAELYEDGTLEKLSNEFLGGTYLPEEKDVKEAK